MSDSGRQMGDCRHGRSQDWCAACLRDEVGRLRSGRFTPQELQELCHSLGREDAGAFKAGCEEYQRSLFGTGAAADEREACARVADQAAASLRRDGQIEEACAVEAVARDIRARAGRADCQHAWADQGHGWLACSTCGLMRRETP